MIAERLPELAAMSREEKLQVLEELENEIYRPEEHEQESPEVSAAIKELLEARWREYQADPDTASPWEIVRQRLQNRLEAWKAEHQRTA